VRRAMKMEKSAIIATCLVNSSIINRLEDAENIVQNVFLTEFPQRQFNEWNREMDDRTAEEIVRNVGRASRINVRKFIEDLF
jgi:hypothetical protein